MWFGGTDKLFELFHHQIRRFGNILVLVDEADVKFGSVNSRDTHETERRLTGGIFELIGDKRMLGKVVWALMTARPERLDPDVKDRTPYMVPIFDLEGEERVAFVRDLFGRKGIKLEGAELEEVMKRTDYYSARAYSFLLARVIGLKEKSVLKVLDGFGASRAIESRRRYQALVASQHCTFPSVLPKWIKDLGVEGVQQEIEKLQGLLL
jgi:hypothetical protein